jgi:hypothetical protein
MGHTAVETLGGDFIKRWRALDDGIEVDAFDANGRPRQRVECGRISSAGGVKGALAIVEES